MGAERRQLYQGRQKQRKAKAAAAAVVVADLHVPEVKVPKADPAVSKTEPVNAADLTAVALRVSRTTEQPFDPSMLD